MVLIVSHKKAGSHEENRHRLCLFCLKRPEVLIEIKGALQTKISDLCDDYGPLDERLPATVCSACKTKVYRLHKNIDESKKSKLISLPDYSKFRPLPKNTRLSVDTKCQCNLREIVTKPAVSKSPIDNENNNINKSKISIKGKKCENCLSSLRPGHKCTANVLINNVKEKIGAKCDVKQKEQLISSLLKDVLKEKESTSKKDGKGKNLIPLSQAHGKPLIVNVQPKVTNTSQISVDSLYQLQSNLNCSNNDIYKIATTIRKGSNDKQIIESNMKQKFQEQTFSFIHVKSNKEIQTPQPVIIRNDLEAFVNFVYTERKQKRDELHLKFGIDGGGGFLKICISLQPKTESEAVTSSNNSAKKFKLSSVKRIFLICLAPNVQENYKNVDLIWSALKINGLLGTVATDLKLANIITGLMTHSSTYPCTWCDARAGELNRGGNPRTIDNCVKNYELWDTQGGRNNLKAKDYKNCVNPPVFASIGDKEIIDIIPPPELHFMLGAVNTMYNHMMLQFPNASKSWASMCNFERCMNYGSPSFEGNQCKKLLDNVDKLRAIFELGCLNFVKAFDDFKKVVDSCFSENLHANYQTNIDQFEKSFGDLGLSFTPKIHAVIQQLSEFCAKTERGLAFYSEQSVESLHYDFNETWENHKVSKNHPDYSKKLLRAVWEYNCHHI